MQQLALTSTK
jgi:2,3-bisphosphoglycerate-dependent phosphoglycerate mutase